MKFLINKKFKFNNKLYFLVIFTFYFDFSSYSKELNNKLGEYTLNAEEQMLLKNLLFDDYIVVLSGGNGRYNIPKNFVLVNSKTLQKEYEKNEVAGDIKYLDKTLAITGDVKSINKTVGDKYYIEFIGEKYSFNSPKAFFKDGNREFLASLSKGENISIICNGAGLNIGSAILSHCIPTSDWIKSQINIDIKKYITINESMNEINFAYAFITMILYNSIPKNSICYKDKITKISSNKCGKEAFKLLKNKIKSEKKSKEVTEFLNKLNIDPKKITKKRT